VSGGGAYGGLEPGADRDPAIPLYPERGHGTVLLRGLRKRCPRCGSRGIFESFFALRERCPRCGLRYQKEEGGFLGAMVVNYIVAVVAWLVLLGIVLALTVPDVPVVALTLASIALLVLLPVAFYPNSKGVWAAVEYLVERSDPDYREPTTRDPRAGDLE
jgi:uncharacterized protein (DUF983 family)